MGTFGLFAGLIVMLYPNTVFVSTIGINIQTMVHHGAMFVMGVFMHVSGRVKYEHKTILKGIAVFGTLCATALIMDVVWHFIGINQTFNMFFISPYYSCELVILQDIQQINYYLFLASYIFGFSLAGYLVLLSSMGIKKLTKLFGKRKNKASVSNETSPETTNNLEVKRIEKTGDEK